MSAQSAGSIRMVAVMGGIGLLCGVLIVVTYQTTLPRIEHNKAQALERAIFEVVPGATRKVVFELTGERLERIDGATRGGDRYYACYDDTSRLVGVAVEASGQGFQDVLRIIYGYSPACECIVGMKVLESRETPGLGDRIESDAAFKANFEALDVKLVPGGESIMNPPELVKHGEKTEPWQIEGITGATISSIAIASIIAKSAAVAVPVIATNLDNLEGGVQ